MADLDPVAEDHNPFKEIAERQRELEKARSTKELPPHLDDPRMRAFDQYDDMVQRVISQLASAVYPEMMTGRRTPEVTMTSDGAGFVLKDIASALWTITTPVDFEVDDWDEQVDSAIDLVSVALIFDSHHRPVAFECRRAGTYKETKHSWLLGSRSRETPYPTRRCKLSEDELVATLRRLHSM